MNIIWNGWKFEEDMLIDPSGNAYRKEFIQMLPTLLEWHRKQEEKVRNHFKKKMSDDVRATHNI